MTLIFQKEDEYNYSKLSTSNSIHKFLADICHNWHPGLIHHLGCRQKTFNSSLFYYLV